MSKWFITSDTHLNHGNIIKYCKRLPFCNEYERNEILRIHTIQDHAEKRKAERELRISRESINKMNHVMIDNINAKVGFDDWLIHAGDFCFGDASSWAHFRARINCRNIILCLGNHDVDTTFKNGIAEEKPVFDERLFTRVFPHGKAVDFLIQGKRYVVNHYAHRSWNQSHRSAAMFYGHTHGALPDDPNILSFDVGVDCHDYKPLSIPEDIEPILAKKTRKKEWFEE